MVGPLGLRIAPFSPGLVMRQAAQGFAPRTSEKNPDGPSCKNPAERGAQSYCFEREFVSASLFGLLAQKCRDIQIFFILHGIVIDQPQVPAVLFSLALSDEGRQVGIMRFRRYDRPCDRPFAAAFVP